MLYAHTQINTRFELQGHMWSPVSALSGFVKIWVWWFASKVDLLSLFSCVQLFLVLCKAAVHTCDVCLAFTFCSLIWIDRGVE